MSKTTIEIITDPRTGDSYKLVHHKSGLDLLLAPMEGFVTTAAMFGTNYGSIINCFKTTDDEDFVTVPDGIAHYLEHKLFENEDSDVFELYAETGADGNAMTGFENTIYLFTCTENYLKSLKILLEFVQKPYFTQENVDKEQGIIAQEIRMTLDLPKRRCFFNLLNAMYHEHPVKVDIAGSEESIKKITPELLYKCYSAFYDLHNMALAVAGNLDVDEVIALCDECLKPCEDKHTEVKMPDEPLTVAEPLVEENFGVGVPIFSIGFKCEACELSDIIVKETEAELMLSLLTGRMSPLAKRLRDEKLVVGPLAHEVFDGRGFFSLIISGESDDPDRVCSLICEEIERVKRDGFCEEDFALLKKVEFGAGVRSMNSPESYAENMLAFYFVGDNAFAQERALGQITLDDVNRAAKELFGENRMTLSVIR
ncbi:Predicted Zn-dependent peptidase [Ruminococcus sp. YE71]|uniref:EF-P 5-aminopentanol modification-associated protein YfmH n=1 Tax=unclassified Ruminococcus TaxID=2608920 RepID=UPI000886DBB9|nr:MULTISPECIES: pitrilysin family protein [unclassified Ruminococcus]SDA23874.1 Predicted Zn-dependent peptidase [Ruminococcus sp. YE78]SFW40660.1 Predicted Zn-dependent peptidase [Ruminococcus sp. YE71]